MATVTYPCYWLKKDQSKQWYWVYYASNGEAISRSSESYHNCEDCRRGITLVQNSGNDKVYKTE